MSNLYILGAGGFAREVALILSKIPYFDFSGYLSDDSSQMGTTISYGKILGTIESVDPGFFVPGIGSPKVRKLLVERALKAGLKPLSICDISSSIADQDVTKIGDGTVICSNCSITCDITIGNYVNVNLNCTVGHDTVIEDYVNLSPGVHLSGYTTLGKEVDIGTGVVILPHISIGEHSVIGAGAVVTKNIPPYSLAVGCPAKIIKELT